MDNKIYRDNFYFKYPCLSCYPCKFLFVFHTAEIYSKSGFQIFRAS